MRWGTYVDERHLSVAQNLYLFWKELCVTKIFKKHNGRGDGGSDILSVTTLYLWIDQLCIDQHNTSERNHQVNMMSQVYAKAASIVVWLYREY